MLALTVQESDDDERREREKKERIEASLREREKEVQRTLSTSLRERDKEREQHKRGEAVQHFKALLADMVGHAPVALVSVLVLWCMTTGRQLLVSPMS